jgi:amylosucrase
VNLADYRKRFAAGLTGDVADSLARFDRWAPDLIAGLSRVYDLDEVLDDLLVIMHSAMNTRSPELKARDRMRVLEPDWFQRPDAIGYVAYADRFANTLRDIRVDYLSDLQVTYLHLMPLLDPRPGANDGGYAVQDFRRVRPDLGTMADLADLADRLHRAGISLTLDLVVNHVAREHAWAEAARRGDPQYQDYFYVFPDRTMPDSFEATLPEIFPAFAPGNFTFDEDLSSWVWTTFNSWQWDLNWSNPKVFCEFADTIAFLANHGVDCLRLDAIAFIWKRLGTNSQNQPEVHAITQALRAFAHITTPALIFKAEAIVGPRDVVAYLGQGEYAGKVADLAYHNSFMVQLWSTFATQDGRLMAHALNSIPPIPINTSWSTYLRCHDDIGWAIDDADAAAVGWDGAAHRAFLADFYAGEFPGSYAAGAHFQSNPLTGDRRTSGTAASLAGLDTSEPGSIDHTHATHRLVCMIAMVLGFGGLPLLYMGDEWALTNDMSYLDDPDHAADNRWMHRPQMPWDELSESKPKHVSYIFEQTRDLIATRTSLASLHATTPTRIHVGWNPGLVFFERRHPAGDLLQVYNVTGRPQTASRADMFITGELVDVHSGKNFPEGDIDIPPYGFMWLKQRRTLGR